MPQNGNLSLQNTYKIINSISPVNNGDLTNK